MNPIPQRQLRVRNDGLDLHVTLAGEGTPVILLHGFPENAHSWRHQLPALAGAGFAAWAPNLRGYPPSATAPWREAYRLPLLVSDVAAVVAATGSPRVHLVGHDWGGIIAWAFAAAHPQLLHKLVIMNAPHMQCYADKVWRSSQLLRSLYVAFFQLPWLPERMLSAAGYRMVRHMFARMPARRGAFSRKDIDSYIGTLSQPGALKAALDYYRINMRPGAMDMVRARVETETLVIWGEQDPALGSFLLDGLHDHVPNATVRRIADAGHWIQNEAPAEVNALLLDFLGADRNR